MKDVPLGVCVFVQNCWMHVECVIESQIMHFTATSSALYCQENYYFVIFLIFIFIKFIG